MSRKIYKKATEEKNNILRLIIIAGLLTIFPFSIFSGFMHQFLKYDSFEYNLVSIAMISLPKFIGLFIYYRTPISKIRGVRTMSILGFLSLIFVTLNLSLALSVSGWDGIGYATLAYGGCFFYFPLMIALLIISLVRLYRPKNNTSKKTSSKKRVKR